MTAPVTGPDGPLYLTTAEVADRFRTCQSTVRDWRHRGVGPKGTRFGGQVLYALPDVEAWERAQIEAEHGRQPTSIRRTA